MNTLIKPKSFGRLLAVCSLVSFTALGTVHAQKDLNDDLASAQTAWSEGDFVQSQSLLEKIVTRHGEGAEKEHGPRFGVIYYRKGIAELKLAGVDKKAGKGDDVVAQWYTKAAESFQNCYTRFAPNNSGKNATHKASLQRWADANIGLKKYGDAAKLLAKFTKERGNGDKFSPTPGGFNAKLASCYFKMEAPQIPKGIEHLEVALQNKVKMETSNGMIVRTLSALSDAVTANNNEAAMVGFLTKNHAHLVLSPYEMYEFTPVLKKLASNALRAKMYVSAGQLYALIPNTDDVLQDLSVRTKQLAGREKLLDGNRVLELAKLKATQKAIRDKQRAGDPDEVFVLSAMSYLHNISGNYRGAFAALEQLELYYNKSSKREENLYSLVQISSALGQIFTTEQYGNRFLKDFPRSERAGDVQRLMLSRLFFSGEYAKSLKISESMIGGLEKGSEQHDICSLVLAGSYFYLGDYRKAQPLLDAHVTEYPESSLILHSKYYQASNLTRLQNWNRASELLEKFVTEYDKPEENIYLASAIYDRANCHFSNNENAQALVHLKRIEEEFADSNVIDSALNMRGEIAEADADLATAEESYKKALAAAEAKGNKIVASEALKYLIGMLGQEKLDGQPNPRLKDALPYYDKFIKDYPDSPFRYEAAVFGLVPMKAAGRMKEALKNLEVTIVQLSKKRNPLFIEGCVNAYANAFLEVEGNTPALLKEKFYNFDGISFKDKRTTALLRISLISVFEKVLTEAKKAENGDLAIRYEADIKVLFNDLKSAFKPEDLSNSILIRVADYLREKTSAPKQSLPYYEALLSRADKGDFELKALLGVADVRGNSDVEADNEKALSTLERVYETSKKGTKTKEASLFRIIEISAKLGKWDQMEAKSRLYLDTKLKQRAALVSYMFARSFDERGKSEEALRYYGTVYAGYTGYLGISAPSVKRVLEIMWERDSAVGDQIGSGEKAITLKKKDRQSAYEIGSTYIRSTAHLRETNKKLSDEDKAVWDQVAALAKEYEDSGDVKTLEEIEKEKK